MDIKTLKKEMEELKKEMIGKFKEKTGLHEMMAVDIFTDGKWRKARIKYFKVDEDKGEVKARVKYCDELGSYSLFRDWWITEAMIQEGKLRVPNKEGTSECYHYWEDIGWTGRYKKVLTLGGWDEREVHRYKCKFCGEVREE